MPREKPKITESDGYHDTSVETHPRYGQIGTNRVSGSGHMSLYGSDFGHQHFVTLTIWESELHRSKLSSDRPFATKKLIEVAMSESQWASLVSSMNVGGGTQCTLEWTREEGLLPEIEPVVDRREQFQLERGEKIENAIKVIDEILAEVEAKGGRMGKEAQSKLRIARAQISVGQDWVAEQFSEHMEKSVEKAKAEINAFTQSTLVRAGAAAIAASESPLLLEAPDKHRTKLRTTVSWCRLYGMADDDKQEPPPPTPEELQRIKEEKEQRVAQIISDTGITELCEKHTWIPRFLLNLRDNCSVKEACEASGITRMQAYRVKNAYPSFQFAWKDAEADGVDELALEARRRGLNGSDLLLMFLLKAHRPEVYRETKGGVNVVAAVKIDWNGTSRMIESKEELTNEELEAIVNGQLTIEGDATWLFDDEDDETGEGFDG